jgi:hypothetical protein
MMTCIVRVGETAGWWGSEFELMPQRQITWAGPAARQAEN